LPKVAEPLAPVVAVAALRVPQAAAGFPLMLKVTVSPPMGPPPVPDATVAVTVRVDALSAGTLLVAPPDGVVNATATVLAT
jgi:hypothetical protein